MVSERGGSGIWAADGARFAGREDRADSVLSGREAKRSRRAGERLQGAGMQIEGHVTNCFGVVADVTGTQICNIVSASVGLDLVTATFGLRLT